jgi:hypothetical protein
MQTRSNHRQQVCRCVAGREGCAAPQPALVPHARRGPSRPESTPPAPARDTPQTNARVMLLFQVKSAVSAAPAAPPITAEPTTASDCTEWAVPAEMYPQIFPMSGAAVRWSDDISSSIHAWVTR